MDINRIEKAIHSIKKDDRPNGSFTTQELSEALGQSAATTRNTIKKLMVAGKAEYVGNHPVLSITGQICKVPFYRMIKK